MGIKNLNKFLHKKSEDIFKTIHLSEYAYKKIAVDISLFLYKFKAISNENWLICFINMICCLRKNNIHCIFIYDGKAPPEKDNEKIKRQQTKENERKKIYDLEYSLNIYHTTGIIEQILYDFYTKNSHKRLLGNNDKIDMIFVENEIKKKVNQIIDITSEDFDKTRELFDILKIPYYTAPEEAEKFCSYLCINGLVDSVLSDDTDVIAYNCPFFLTKLDIYNDTFVEISNKNVLNILNNKKNKKIILISAHDFTDAPHVHENMLFTDFYEWFDFLGKISNKIHKDYLWLVKLHPSDYNNNIPKIGPENAFKYISKYITIEEIEKNLKIDVKILNYIRVRELFTIFDKYEIINISYCMIPNFDDLIKFTIKNSLKIDIEKVIKDFTVELIFEDF